MHATSKQFDSLSISDKKTMKFLMNEVREDSNNCHHHFRIKKWVLIDETPSLKKKNAKKEVQEGAKKQKRKIQETQTPFYNGKRRHSIDFLLNSGNPNLPNIAKTIGTPYPSIDARSNTNTLPFFVEYQPTLKRRRFSLS